MNFPELFDRERGKSAQREIGRVDKKHRHGRHKVFHASFVFEARTKQLGIEQRAPAGQDAPRKINPAMRAQRKRHIAGDGAQPAGEQCDGFFGAGVLALARGFGTAAIRA